MIRDWTGRRWLEIGPLVVGFGPDEPVERVYWRGQLVWANVKAVYLHRLQALAYESGKQARRAYRDYVVNSNAEPYKEALRAILSGDCGSRSDAVEIALEALDISPTEYYLGGLDDEEV